MKRSLTIVSMLAYVASAWVTQPCFFPKRQKCTTSTQLRLFDWFKPKPATSSAASNPSKIDDTATTTTEAMVEETETEDKVANAFNRVDDTDSASSAEPVTITEPNTEETPATTINEIKDTVVAQESTASSAESSDHVLTGKVAWFDKDRGFGFIQPNCENDGAENNKKNQVFVHQTEIQANGFRMLHRGEDVEYCLTLDAQGRSRAKHVTGPSGGKLRVELNEIERENENSSQ